MKKKINCLVLLSIIMLFANCSKDDKANWFKEAPAKRYSEKREKEVWGKILYGRSPEIFYGTALYELALEMTSFYWFRSDSKIERLIKELPKHNINYQEGKFGNTIGHFALTVSDLKALRLLLDRGLNPNLMKCIGRLQQYAV